MKKRNLALLMTFATPDAENRLKTQLSELMKLNFEVHTLGLGDTSLPGVSRHFQLPEGAGLLGFVRKALVHLTKEPKDRFRLLRFPPKVVEELNSFRYNLVVAHDLELLPALTDPLSTPSAFDNAIKQVDLHELHEFVAPADGVLGFMWWVLKYRLLPYHDWLFAQLRSDSISVFSVVNKSIGDWYVSNGHIKNFIEVRNAAPLLDLEFEPRTSPELSFLYHGKFASRRGIENLVEASLQMNPGDSMSFMLTGDDQEIERFTSYALARNPSIKFYPPVSMGKVSNEISKFDVEIIYFEPVTKNLLYTLPNKFFEAIQGRLAVISGPSPELVRHTDELGNGIHFDTWGFSNLSQAIRSLDRQKVEQMRIKSHVAALALNAQSEGAKLRETWQHLFGLSSTKEPDPREKLPQESQNREN